MSKSIVLEEAAADDGTVTPRVSRFDPASASSAPLGEAGLSLDSVMRIPVTVQVILGSTTMPVANLMRLTQGAIVPLDNRVGEPVDVVVNGRVVARGELVVMDDDNTRFGISLTEVVGAQVQSQPHG